MISINVQIVRYFTDSTGKTVYVCFRHAVATTLNTRLEITEEVVDGPGDGNDMRDFRCDMCRAGFSKEELATFKESVRKVVGLPPLLTAYDSGEIDGMRE